MSLTVGVDTYLTLADADAYFSGRLLSAAWSGLATTDKEAALKMACRYMDRLNWQGERADQTQVLAWPRTGVFRWGHGESELDDQIVPEEITHIQCEIALWLVREQGSEEMGPARSITVPGLSVAFGPGCQSSWPPYLKTLLSPWLATRSSSILELGRG
jgi:hypothetical protein